MLSAALRSPLVLLGSLLRGRAGLKFALKEGGSPVAQAWRASVRG